MAVSSHLKHICQNGNLPQFSGWKSTNIWNHHLDIRRLSYKTFHSELATQLSLQLFRENLPFLTVKTQLHRGSVEISSPKESETFDNNDFWSPFVMAVSKGSDWSAQLQNMLEIIQTRSMTFRVRCMNHVMPLGQLEGWHMCGCTFHKFDIHDIDENIRLPADRLFAKSIFHVHTLNLRNGYGNESDQIPQKRVAFFSAPSFGSACANINYQGSIWYQAPG